MGFKPKTPSFKSPPPVKIPKPAPAPDLPTIADPQVEENARRQRRAAQYSGLGNSTVLTGYGGVTNESTKKTVLGG